VKFPKCWREIPAIHPAISAPVLKHKYFLHLARPLHLIMVGPMVGFEIEKGFIQMFATFTSARETATLFAGAFISALLLVSAATSLPIV
jgi:hypothetical protein